MAMAPKRSSGSAKKRRKKTANKRVSRRPPRLSAKQLLFCDAYVRLLDARLAAIEAGYSEKSARTTGPRLLRNAAVLARIEVRLKERLDAEGLNAEDAWRRIRELAFSRLTDVAKWTADTVALIPSENVSPEGKAGIASVMVKPGEYGTTLSVRMRDPLPALVRIVEACEKAKEPEKTDDRPNLGTILYFPAATHVTAELTGVNDSNDGAGDS